MRISIPLVISIIITIAIAHENAESSLKIPSNTTTTTKASKRAKKPIDNRGKRTLNNFGYPGISYSASFANRRQEYGNQRSLYSQDGLYNGENAVGQYPLTDASNNLQDFGQYSQYSQYLEAPEPIIEIIIKDSNESHTTQAPQPIVHKKKKEKVHVYYVKYKKDENNKLHLEEPIASLNNNDATEEEEEIIHYPSIVTPLPPLKTTTLRTIIHPDSEKFHSNSGIHVTFGSEDKSQRGHELQEDNAESVQRSVVALPQGSNYALKPMPTANVRADFADSRAQFSDRYQGSQNNFYQSQNQNVLREYKPAIQQQQLPGPQALTAFRPHLPFQPQQQPQQITQSQQTQQGPSQQQHNQNFPQQQQQQRPFFNQAPQGQVQKQYQRPSTSASLPPSQYQNLQQQNTFQQQQLQQQSYQFQHQQQQQPVLKQQQYPQQYQQQQQQFKRPVALTQKHNHFLPTLAPKSSEQLSRQNSGAYQPVKFRPTPVPNQENHKFPPLAHIQSYNRPPSFIQMPSFPGAIPAQGSQVFQSINHSPKILIQKSSSPRPELLHSSQHLPVNHKAQSENSFGTNASPSLGQLHNVLDIRPSKETELLKAIPRYEQHITETVPRNRHNHYSPFTGGSQAIHDIPAPNLGPTTPSSSQLPASAQQANNHFNGFITSPNPVQYQSTAAPQFAKTSDGQEVQIVTPMPPSNFYNHKLQRQSQYLAGTQPQIIPNSQPTQQRLFSQEPRQSEQSQFSVSTLHSDVFRELESLRNNAVKKNSDVQHRNNFQNVRSHSQSPTTPAAPSTTSKNAAKASLQLPEEVPDELRQQLLTSGILDNADISVLDYDKVGDVALENLPAEHLQHFYGAGGGAQISESNKVLTVVKPNGDSVDFSEKSIANIKESKSLPQKQTVDLKVVRFNANNEKRISGKFIKSDSTVVPPIDLTDRQYSRYLPLKINGAQFPIPEVEELRGKKVTSVVVLAPVDNLQQLESAIIPDEGRSERETPESKDVKFAIGDVIKQLIKKPTKDNFRKWLEKESRTDVDSQSVVLLVAKSSEDEQEIFMYDITTGAVNKLNGELSSAFVSVAEENASAENLDHASTLDPSILENMMENKKSV